MTIGTRLFTLLNGELVGTDSSGNRYYRGRRSSQGRRERRWVLYKGAAEASTVPADWHGWLHHRTNDVPPPGGHEKRPWQKDHVPNLTGTDLAYRPPGHVLRGARRDHATGDYEPWRPS
jgi:NADH:ubiquinone oxidoreductase subunit